MARRWANVNDFHTDAILAKDSGLFACRPERADLNELISIEDISLQGQYGKKKVAIGIHKKSNEE